MALTKKEWRAFLRQQLQNESNDQKDLKQKSLDRHLVEFLKSQSGVWAAYKALPSEANPARACELSSHIRWVYPRIEGENLAFFLGDEFVQNSLGIWEPGPRATQVQQESLSGILVPGLGFSDRGQRLGRGKGFYDRVLVGTQALKVGVCFSSQLVKENLPVDEHDIPMDVVIVDHQVYDFR